MNFSSNKTPIEIIKEGAFGGTYFRDIYLVLIKNGMKIHGKKMAKDKLIDGKKL